MTTLLYSTRIKHLTLHSALIVGVCIFLSACQRSAPSVSRPQSPRRSVDSDITGLQPKANPNQQTAPLLVAKNDEGVTELQAVSARESAGVLADEIKLGDQQGNWQSETFHEAIKPHLKTLAKAIESRNWQQSLSNLVFEPFVCSALRPEPSQLVQGFEDQNFTVFRPSTSFRTESQLSGVAEFERQLQQLTSPFLDNSPLAVHFKVYKVLVSDDQAQSEVYVDTDGRGKTGGVQQTMQWQCRWRKTTQDDWKLASIQLVHFEEVHYARSAGGKLFSDCTTAILADNDSFPSHLQYGIDHWRFRLEERMGIDSVSLAGLAIGDVNGDGLDDLYFCDVGGLPNRLFLQRTDGTVQDVSAAAGVDWSDRSHGALFADLDNDGDQDLVVSAGTSILLMENNGTGQFTVRTRLQPQPTAQSLSAVDYDGDGRLDIYVCSYGSSLESFSESKTPLPWHDANNGTPNTMFRNLGDWKYADTTAAIGLSENNQRYSYSAAWDDFDNDGDQDLYVANDFGRNNLFINEMDSTGRFRDVAREFAVEDISPGMSADWGDFNNDGRMDLYVSNMFSAAGNRITFQERFMRDSAEELVGNYRRFARGNTLFRSKDRTFDDVSVRANVTMGRWAWSSMFADINNDGWQDLLVTNGHVTGIEPDDL